MNYAAHAAATAAPPAAVPHPTYAHPYGYPYTYPAYNQPDPAAAAAAAAADPSAASSSSSYYYSNPTGAPADAQAQYNPYAKYHQYYAPSAPVPYGGGGLWEYYFTAGEASQAPAVSAAQAAPEATAREKVKHFGFDPHRYALVAAAKAPNGMAPAASAAATVMDHAQWKIVKKIPKVVQPVTCEVCKIECDTLEVLVIHKTGKKHMKNLNKLQDSITPKPAKPPNGAVGASTAAAPAVAGGKVVQPVTCEVCKIECDTLEVLVIHKRGKKHKKNLNKLQDSITPKPAKPPNGAVGASSAATPEILEVKKRRVLEAGAAQGEVKICTACNVVVNS